MHPSPSPLRSLPPGWRFLIVRISTLFPVRCPAGQRTRHRRNDVPRPDGLTRPCKARAVTRRGRSEAQDGEAVDRAGCHGRLVLRERKTYRATSPIPLIHRPPRTRARSVKSVTYGVSVSNPDCPFISVSCRQFGSERAKFRFRKGQIFLR